MTAQPQQQPRRRPASSGAPPPPPPSAFRVPGALRRTNLVSLPDGYRASVEPPVTSDGFLGEAFVMDSQEFLCWLSDYYRDDIVTLRLIIRMMGMQKPGGTVEATQSRLAELLKVKQSQISRSLKDTGSLGVTAKVKAGLYQLHPRLSLRGGRVPMEPRPGTRAQGTLKVDQLSLLDAIEDNPDLPGAFKELRQLPDPEEKPLREDKTRAQARAAKKGRTS
ncbi:hypothetical protein OHR86_34040 (plasmid) [Streptomyces sp. NBC_00441]|uniref:hypothetical protein n=1 Tax=Streptomyces sp. NBC_00441 TaxID=2975742 RepID=UPI002E2C9FDA|nr:hypothetical protein [Streptomyces sp. NBC_00441]